MAGPAHDVLHVADILHAFMYADRHGVLINVAVAILVLVGFRKVQGLLEIDELSHVLIRIM